MRPRNLAARHALQALLRRGPLGATAVADALGISPRTALRVLSELGEQGFAGGAASRRRYALRRPLRGKPKPLPIFRIDTAGKAAEVASLNLIEPTGCHCDLAPLGWPVDAESRDGWWGGLPYPLYDMQPQGFLGRNFARREHAALEVAADPREWGDDDIAYVLSRRGSDVSGNLIVGELALRAWQADVQERQSRPDIREAELLPNYLAYAEEAVSMGRVGSSAAGEFPKFTAMRSLPNSEGGLGTTPHVIVKFSGRERSAATKRWSDLLVCEDLALRAVAMLPGITPAHTRLLQAGGRTFIESERFDRQGRHGRSPLVSLHALNGHLLGLPTQDWRAHADTLHALRLLEAEGVAAIHRLWWFGRLIGNSDMHLGNLSFIPAESRFRIAPIYDMLPMAYAPLPGGELPKVQWRFEAPMPAEREAWLQAAQAALGFWQEVAKDSRLTGDFRLVGKRNRLALQEMADRE